MDMLNRKLQKAVQDGRYSVAGGKAEAEFWLYFCQDVIGRYPLDKPNDVIFGAIFHSDERNMKLLGGSND